MTRKQSRIKEVIALLILIFVGIFLPFIITFEEPNYIEIQSDKDFLKYDFEGNGTFDNPFLIEDLFINNAQKRGISISNTESFFVIRNCYLSYNLLDGIRIMNVKNGTALVFNNTIIGHSFAGINIHSSNSIKIFNNNCFENKRGILIENSTNSIISNNIISRFRRQSHLERFVYIGLDVSKVNFTIIKENYVKFTTYGISLEDSYKISLTNNIVEQTSRTGISLRSSMKIEIANCSSFENIDAGIDLRYSMQNTIVNTTLTNNKNGIYIYESNENIIEHNTIEFNNAGILSTSSSHGNEIRRNNFTNNLNAGIKIDSSQYSRIHHNNFVFNNIDGISQCEDNGLNNSWYDNYTLEGNYWNDWNTTDPYKILGSANSTDLYPMLFAINNYQFRSYYFISFSLVYITFTIED